MAQPPDFLIFLTDGDASHLPSQQERDSGYKTADEYGLAQKALSNFAFEMTKKVVGKGDKGSTYNKIPTGYSAWPRQRAPDGSEQKIKLDWYIFGHPRHVKFDSFAQFAIHMNTLQLQLPPGNCTCKVCLRHPLTEDDPIMHDPVPATMVTTTDEAAAPRKAVVKKPKVSRPPNVQAEAGPSTQRARQSKNRPNPTHPSGEEKNSDEVYSSVSNAFPSGRPRRAISRVQYAERLAISDNDSDVAVSAGDSRSGDEGVEYTGDRDSETEQGKQPSKRVLSSKAAGKQPEKRYLSSRAAGKQREKRVLSPNAAGKHPIKHARVQSDDDRMDVDQEVGDPVAIPMDVDHEEEGSTMNAAQAEESESEYVYDSDDPIFEDAIVDPDVLRWQSVTAEYQETFHQKLFTRMKRVKELWGPMDQLLESNFEAPEKVVHKMLTELPQQGSWVFRIGEIVCYIEAEAEEFRQARLKTDAKFWQINPKTRELLGRPKWRAGVIVQVPDRVVSTKTLGEKYGEEPAPLRFSGWLIEPFPNETPPKKGETVESIYVPTRNICPFTYAIELHKGVFTRHYHGSVFAAMERMCTFSLVYPQYVRAEWPDCIMYYGGIYLGAELLLVGDAVRIKSERLEKGCNEILIINSIKMKYNDLEAEEDGKTVTGEKAKLKRLLVRGYGYTTNQFHQNKCDPVPFTEEANVHPALRQQQKSVTWYRIGTGDQEMEIDFSRIMGRVFESSVVMKWFSQLWYCRMEEETLNQGHESLLQMRKVARAKMGNLGFDKHDNKGAYPRWFWARDRVHALNLIHRGGTRLEGAKALRTEPIKEYWARYWPTGRDPRSWRSIFMKVDADNLIDFPGEEKANLMRKFIGRDPRNEQPPYFKPGRYYNIVNKETFDHFTKGTEQIFMDKAGQRLRRRELQKWWNSIYFVWQ